MPAPVIVHLAFLASAGFAYWILRPGVRFMVRVGAKPSTLAYFRLAPILLVGLLEAVALGVAPVPLPVVVAATVLAASLDPKRTIRLAGGLRPLAELGFRVIAIERTALTYWAAPAHKRSVIREAVERQLTEVNRLRLPDVGTEYRSTFEVVIRAYLSGGLTTESHRLLSRLYELEAAIRPDLERWGVGDELTRWVAPPNGGRLTTASAE